MRAISHRRGRQSVRSHAPATFCIHVPTYETTDAAAQRARETESASGSSADLDRPTVSLGAVDSAAPAGGARPLQRWWRALSCSGCHPIVGTRAKLAAPEPSPRRAHGVGRMSQARLPANEAFGEAPPNISPLLTPKVR
jgi:hypothetical protein